MTKFTKKQLPAGMLDDYIKLQQKIKELTAQLDEMKPAILLAAKGGGGEINHGEFKIVVCYKPTYKYTEDILKLEEKLKGQKGLIDARKKNEIETGKATKVDDGAYVTVKKVSKE